MKSPAVVYELDSEIKNRLDLIIDRLGFKHINRNRIFCVKSKGSKSRAIARIYSFPRIWQEVLKTPPHYIIEVVEKRFSKLPPGDQDRVLIHELMHIPKTFSGALVPHLCFGKKINRREVERLYSKLTLEKPL